MKNALIVSHIGLGDNICMISALNYLKDHYNKLYFPCQEQYVNECKLLIDIDNIEYIPIKKIYI